MRDGKLRLAADDPETPSPIRPAMRAIVYFPLQGSMSEKTVLLIEDDRDSRQIYGTVLRHAGYRVVEATNGGEGIVLAQRHRPDVIVMDLGLPQVDGWAATEAIRRDPATSRIPVIAVTVHVQDFYRGRAEVVGCDSFLDKPCSPTRLIGEVTRVLQERE